MDARAEIPQKVDTRAAVSLHIINIYVHTYFIDRITVNESHSQILFLTRFGDQ